MAKSAEQITTNGRAVFYASIWGDLKKAAESCGWALALHGSLSSDIDIMAMKWVENSFDAVKMVKEIQKCIYNDTKSTFNTSVYLDKPHYRIVFTIHIWADFYIDLCIVDHNFIIEWEQSDEMELISVHDKVYLMIGYDNYGNTYQAIGEYSLGELAKITNIEIT